MNRIDFVLKGRGFRNAVQRVKSIRQRFGWDPTRFMKKVEILTRLTERYGVRPSFPISTVLLTRYRNLAKELAHLPLDLLNHGYTHIDYTNLTRQEQRSLIQRSTAILSSEGFTIDGFRAPYLHWNEDLLDTISENGLEFDSSVVHWCLPESAFSLNADQHKIYQRACNFYQPFFGRPENGSKPYFLSNGLLEIPVTVPDDEILIDRLNFKEPFRLSEVLLTVLNQTYEEEGLFNLQLHPERGMAMGEALEALLQASRLKSPAVWLASLRDINTWWREKDRFDIDWQPIENGIRLKFRNVARATLLLKTSNDIRDTSPWIPPFVRVMKEEFFLPGKTIPVIGLKGAGETLRPVLKKMGYLVGKPTDAGPYALTFSQSASRDMILDEIDHCPFPLLRLGTWPHGCRSALSVTGDIDCMTIQDFAWRFTEVN